MSTDNTSVTSFSSFDLPKPLADALETMRHREPTPIQSKAIPVIMEGKDLIGIAQTGTGKTAAFGIPLVKRLIEDKDAQAVILVPTRELAVQIYEVIRQLTQNVKSLKSWVLVGGTSMYAQVKSLPRKPRIIIATPGRLQDHLDKRTFSLDDLKIAVLDEADRMLDIGFEPQINRIFQKLPKERQTLLFSATFPKTIERLTREYMNHPAKITVGKVSEPAKEIEQSFVHTTVAGKNQLLIKELNERTGSVLIFVRTKHKVDRIARLLMDEGFEADRIHGARTQGQRNRVMQDFRTMKIRIMVATDVASRGIDIPHIEHVINYDIPEVPEDYVHRIGRTARAGAKGKSISFLTSEDKTKWMYLQRHLNALGVRTAFSAVKVPSILDKPIEVKNPDGTVAKESKEPMIEYKKPREYANTTSRYNRSQGHFKRQSESRGGERSYAPRGDSRGPRSEGRSFAPRGDRPSSGFDRPRSRSTYSPASDSRPRGEGRPYTPRGDSRGPRSEGRSFAPRGEGRGPARSYAPRGNGPRPSRPYAPRDDSRGPRSDSRGPRSEGRSFGNRDSRPSYGRPDSQRPRSEGRPFAPRGDSRGPRSNSGRPFAPRGERKTFAPRSPDGRSFTSSRPTGDRRPMSRDGKPYGGSNSKPFTRSPKPTSRPSRER